MPIRIISQDEARPKLLGMPPSKVRFTRTCNEAADLLRNGNLDMGIEILFTSEELSGLPMKNPYSALKLVLEKVAKRNGKLDLGFCARPDRLTVYKKPANEAAHDDKGVSA